MKHRIRALMLAAAVISIAACTDDADPTGLSTTSLRLRLSNSVGGSTYVLMSPSGRFKGDIAAQVAAAGGHLESNLSEIGVATATSDDPGFAARARKISGVASVDADQFVQWVKPEAVTDVGTESVEGEAVAAPVEAVTNVFGGADETYWNLQWNVRAVHAPDAWAAGQTGAGVRVAVIDGGMSRDHVDLVGRIDVDHSESFVTGRTWDQDVGTSSTFRHATHVAGIIAANDNGIGTIGIAPDATIIAVKALHGGGGSFSAIIRAIEYASRSINEGGAGANIINMSLGATFGRDTVDGSSHLIAAMSRATSQARQRGVLVIAASGNDTVNMDHAPHVVSIPAQSVGVVSVAATGPNGYALGATDYSRPTIYSNIGQSFVSFAAPGGSDDDIPGISRTALCGIRAVPSSLGFVVAPCWVFDMVVGPSSGTGGYSFSDGTSMAAPAAAGVAALILSSYGPMSPAQLEAHLRSSATDLGKPGNDDFYGAGFVDARGAIR